MKRATTTTNGDHQSGKIEVSHASKHASKEHDDAQTVKNKAHCVVRLRLLACVRDLQVRDGKVHDRRFQSSIPREIEQTLSTARSCGQDKRYLFAIGFTTP
jgi:hypothetical protein